MAEAGWRAARVAACMLIADRRSMLVSVFVCRSCLSVPRPAAWNESAAARLRSVLLLLRLSGLEVCAGLVPAPPCLWRTGCHTRARFGSRLARRRLLDPRRKRGSLAPGPSTTIARSNHSPRASNDPLATSSEGRAEVWAERAARRVIGEAEVRTSEGRAQEGSRHRCCATMPHRLTHVSHDPCRRHLTLTIASPPRPPAAHQQICSAPLFRLPSQPPSLLRPDDASSAVERAARSRSCGDDRSERSRSDA